MNFIETKISGVWIIQYDRHGDSRGFLAETYRKSLFSEYGIHEEFIQDNHSQSDLGTLRGLHYQTQPYTQSKLVRVVTGEIFDVAVDLRDDSPTYGKWVGEFLSAENNKMLYIPEGFAHGFLVTDENTHVVYKISDYYSPEHEEGVLWNDPELAIEWPKLEVSYTISDKDKKHPHLKEIEGF